MRDSWYYAVPEGQVGPITLEELKHTLPTLPNAQDVYIWHDSLPDWIRAGDLADIVANAKAATLQPAESPDPADEDSSDTPIDERTDAPSLDGFHPDREYSLTMPAPEPEAEASATVKGERSRLRLLVGVGLMLVGCAVFYLGISGTVTWAERVIGLKSTLVDAAFGAALLVVGVFVFLARRRKPVS